MVTIPCMGRNAIGSPREWDESLLALSAMLGSRKQHRASSFVMACLQPAFRYGAELAGISPRMLGDQIIRMACELICKFPNNIFRWYPIPLAQSARTTIPPLLLCAKER